MSDCGKCHKCLEGKVRKIHGSWITDGSIIEISLAATYMILCPVCGNKRCPHASDHELACTNSNEPGQRGSVYGPIAPPEVE